MNDNDIHAEMEKLQSPVLTGCYMFDDYTIRGGKVEVEGSIFLPSHYTSIPVPFRSVSETFSCGRAHISSLHNSPIEVGVDFYCTDTNISTLTGGPREVHGSYVCGWTNITSLKHSPTYVGRDFNCSDTNITSLVGSPGEVGGDLICILDAFEDEPDASHVKVGGSVVWHPRIF